MTLFEKPTAKDIFNIFFPPGNFRYYILYASFCISIFFLMLMSYLPDIRRTVYAVPRGGKKQL